MTALQKYWEIWHQRADEDGRNSFSEYAFDEAVRFAVAVATERYVKICEDKANAWSKAKRGSNWADQAHAMMSCAQAIRESRKTCNLTSC